MLGDNRTQFAEPSPRQFASQFGEFLFRIFVSVATDPVAARDFSRRGKISLTGTVTANAAGDRIPMSHNKVAKNSDLVVAGIVVESIRSSSAATPNAKRHDVPAHGQSSPIDDFRATRGFICLNIVAG